MTARRPEGKRVCVAKIGAPHGVRGDVKLWAYTADPMAVRDYGALSTANGERTFVIDALRPAKDCLIAHFRGVADRDAAEALRHIELYVDRERMPATVEDEFYHADLVGLSVQDDEGAAVGTVTAVHNFGAGDLIEIAVEKGGKAGASLLLPFTQESVPVVDIAAGRLMVSRGALAAATAAGEE